MHKLKLSVILQKLLHRRGRIELLPSLIKKLYKSDDPSSLVIIFHIQSLKNILFYIIYLKFVQGITYTKSCNVQPILTIHSSSVFTIL